MDPFMMGDGSRVSSLGAVVEATNLREEAVIIVLFIQEDGVSPSRFCWGLRLLRDWTTESGLERTIERSRRLPGLA